MIADQIVMRFDWPVQVLGSWYDPANPVVVRPSGQVRPDIWERLSQSADTADLCLVIGSSLRSGHFYNSISTLYINLNM